MGRVYKRTDSPHWYIDYTNADGDRLRRSLPEARSKRQAEAVLRKLEGDALAGRHGLKVGVIEPTFGDLARQWLSDYSKIRLRSHAENELRIGKHLLPRFSDRQASKVRGRDVERMMRDMAQANYAAQSINHVRKDVGRIYAWAIGKGLIDCPNPCSGVKALPMPQSGYEFLSTDEIGAVAQVIQGHVEDPKSGGAPFPADALAMFMVATLAGLRRGEVYGLRWQDLDLDRRLITVRKSYEGAPKSGKDRKVPLHSAVVAELRRLQGRHLSSLVFPSPASGTMRSHRSPGWWKAVLKEAGIVRHVRWHDLRHTFGTAYARQGGNLATLQRIMGHSSIIVTMKYAHPDEYLHDEMERTFTLLGGPSQPDIGGKVVALHVARK